MASYAAVMTLMDLMVQIQRYHSRHHVFDDHQQTQLQSLREKVSFMQDFLETTSSNNYSCRDSDDDERLGLESRIADAAYAAEDVIESYIVDHVLARSKGEMDQINPSKFTLDVQKVIGDFDSLTGEVLEIRSKSKVLKNPFPQEPETAGSSRILNTQKDFLVGIDDIFKEITDKLTGRTPNRQVIALTGMGGIGKSTLAKKAYDNHRSSQHFDVCAWVTVSQVYTAEDLLIQLLKECKISQSGNGEPEYHRLGEIVHKHLKARRYFIVIDDIWSLDAWDKIRLFLPEDNNSSRIILTTRLSHLVTNIGSCHICKVNLLNDDESWSLLHRKVFMKENCPPELEEVGKMIARNCKGLPLSIAVISGLLKRSLKREYWKCIEEDVSAHVNSEDNAHCLKILYLSYSCLHVHLKPCFLHLGVFQEDQRIKVTELKRLWVAEGFLKPKEGKTLEQAAYDYLKDLIDRNLVLVNTFGHTGNVKYVIVHDLVRDFCLKEAHKERFLYICKDPELELPQGFDRYRRLAIQGPHGISRHTPFHASRPLSFLRSVVRNYPVSPTPLLDLKLLKIWHGAAIYGVGSDDVGCIKSKVNLRYIFLGHDRDQLVEFLSSGHLPWNVQTIICGYSERILDRPLKIWDMPHLRHLMLGDVYLDGLSGENMDLQHNNIVLEDLQTLGYIVDFCCTEAVLRRLPNIKTLKIIYGDEKLLPSCCLDNLSHLDKLESLYCIFCVGDETLRFNSFQNMGFSLSLKKLTLEDCNFIWEDMGRKIGSLPHLEKLRLVNCRGGEVWNLVDGQFPCLKYLEISNLYGFPSEDDEYKELVEWTADNTHFPSLETLVLEGLKSLEEISPEIGEIPTLRSITVSTCSDSTKEWAKMILEEQRSFENEDFMLKVYDF